MPLDLRSLIYGNNSNNPKEAGEQPSAVSDKQQQQPNRKRVRIVKEEEENTSQKKQKFNNQDEKNHHGDSDIKQEQDGDVSLKSEAAADAAAVAVGLSTDPIIRDDEKAIEAAKRLKKTTAHLKLLFGQHCGDDDDNNDDEELDMDDDEDDDVMNVRKPPPSTTSAAGATVTNAAATSTATTTTAASTTNDNAAIDKESVKEKTSKKRRMTEQEKIQHEQQRQQKLERCREWEYIRNRWKDRKVDLRKEVDVGNVIHKTIVRLLQKQKQQQQRAKEEKDEAAAAAKEQVNQPPAAVATTTTAATVAAINNDDDLNSTDDEQEILLNRLLHGNAQARQQQQAAAGMDNNDILTDTIESTLVRPYAERGLDYWEMGNTRPPSRSPQQKFAPHDSSSIRYIPTYEQQRIINNNMANNKKKKRMTNNVQQEQQQRVSITAAALKKNAAYEAENERLGFYNFPSTTTTTMPLEDFHASSSAWPLSHPSRSNVTAGPEHGWFFHRRLVLRLAARQLVGSPIASCDDDTTTTTSTNNRLIRALWNTKLADSHRQSLLLSEAQNAGMRMEAFLTHVWKNRTMVANLLGVSTVRIGEEQQRGHAAIMAVLPVAFMGTTVRPYTKQCKSYIDRLVRQQANTGQRIEWDPNSKHGITQKKTGRQNFTVITTSSYIPTPGTVPPIPCFPLDETQCIFGPMDKHATAQHASYFTEGGHEIPTVDDTVYRLTLSTLLARWATAIAVTDSPSAASARGRSKKSSTTSDNNFLLDDDDDDNMNIDEKKNDYRFMVQDQIERMVQQTVELNKNSKYKRLGPLTWLDDDGEGDGLPLVPLYRAVLGYCSLEACGYREHQGSNNNINDNNNHWDDNEYYDDDDSYSRRQENARNNKVTLKMIAQDTIQFCEKYQDHNGLLSFPKLHMILALLGLSTELPESGVEILAQPLDELHNQTPFDIMRSLLEHLEEVEFISNNVAILEFAMYQAAERFGRCVQKDPAQVTYHTWHLGTLAGCLLLCSGNRIGSGAGRFPSALSSSSSLAAAGASSIHFRRSLGGDSNDDIDYPPHEVRRKLPKFHELRLETARAFKLLLQLTNYQQKSPRCNLAVASFLEWSQVIALMLGPPSFVDIYYDPFEDIRALHSRHFNDLILSGQVPLSMLTEFQRRMSKKPSNRDCRLMFLANALERDPGRLKSWRALVRALGPVGICVDPERRESCAECQECRRVHKNLNVDHEAFNHDRDCNSGGWANNRINWWESHLLHVPKAKAGQNIEKFCSVVESQLDSISVADRSAGAGEADETDDSSPSLKWLEDIISSDIFDNADAQAPSSEDREQVYDMDLPASFLESSHDDSDSETDSSGEGDDIPLMNPFPFDDGAAVRNEIRCYKLTVLCHMYGLLHPHVDRILIALLNECWDEDQVELQTNCTAWTCLAWLYSWVGLDVLAPIRKELSSQPEINPAASAGDCLSGAQVRCRRVNKTDGVAYLTVENGLKEPMQIDESDTSSIGGDYDDNDIDGRAVNVERLVGALGIPTNPTVDLEREATCILQETLNKDKQPAPPCEPQQPPAEDDPNTLPEAASKLITPAARSPSTDAAPPVPAPNAAPTATMLTNVNALERETTRITQQILKNAVQSVVPARDTKGHKSRKPRTKTKAMEDFESVAIRNLHQVSQRWFPGYKPPEKPH